MSEDYLSIYQEATERQRAAQVVVEAAAETRMWAVYRMHLDGATTKQIQRLIDPIGAVSISRINKWIQLARVLSDRERNGDE